MRVLLSAFSCAPGSGSEAGIGWQTVLSAAEEHKIWVLTDPENRTSIEDPRSYTPPDAQFHYIQIRGAAVLRRGALIYLYYALWQVAAFRTARRLHREFRFDLVHHVSFGNCWMPSFMGRLGIPFLWYAGSTTTTPTAFLKGMTWKSTRREVVRSLAIRIGGMIARALTVTAATTILTVDPTGDNGGRRKRFVPAGLQLWEFKTLEAAPVRTEEPFRVVSIGRLIGWKGFHLGIEAFARVAAQIPSAEYWIIGDGADRQWFESLAQRSGSVDRVRFLGWRNRDETWQLLTEADVLLHPSLHEQLGYVVLEAMAAGRPVVCVDAAAPPWLVGDSGIVVEAASPDRTVAGLADALVGLGRNPDRRLELGARARERAGAMWSDVKDQLMTIYDAAAAKP